MPDFPTELRVRYAECDAQGHVFNAHYLTWFDIAHTEMLRALVGPYPEIVARGIDVLVHEASLRFRRGARFDEVVSVVATPRPPTTSSLTTDFRVMLGDETLAEGWLRHVCVDPRSHAKVPWPPWCLDVLPTG